MSATIIFRLLLVLLIISISQATLSAAESSGIGADFQLTELQSNRLMTLSEFRGKVVYLDFWASWCGPCRKSLPLYEILMSEFEGKSFQMLAINLDENQQDAERFLQKHPVSYPVLLDSQGDSARQWQIKAMPTSFLLDADGNVLKTWAGFEASHIEEIRNEINSLLD